MILNDVSIEEYINQDITNVDLDNLKDLSGYDPDVALTIKEKLQFRKSVSQKMSIARLNYFAIMLRRVFDDISLPLPENYSDKLKQLVKNSGMGGAKRADSNKSFFSMVSKTNMSSVRTDDDSYDE